MGKIYNSMSLCDKFKIAGRNIKNYFFGIEVAFKVYITITLAFLIVTQIYPELHQVLLFTPEFVVEKYQYWRLFSSFLTTGQLSFINVLFLLLNFWFLNFSLRRIVLSYLQMYLFSEILKQNFIINLLLTVLFYPLIGFGVISSYSIINMGSLAVSINFVCQLASRGMQEQFKILCMPLKLKYLPWLQLLILIGFYTTLLLTFTGIFVICMLQHYCFTKPLLALPLGLYQGIDHVLPSFVVQMKGYIKVSQVSQLAEICRTWCKTGQRRRQNVSDNSRFKQHWKEKQFDPPIQSQKVKQNEQAPNPIERQVQNKGKQMDETQIKCDTSNSEIFESKLIDYKSHWKSKYADQDDGVASHETYNGIIVQGSAHKRIEGAQTLNNFVPASEDRSLNDCDRPKYNNLGLQHQILNNSQLEPQLQQQQRQKKGINASKDMVKYSAAEDQQQWY